MYALKPSYSPAPPVRRNRTAPRPKTQAPRRPYRAIVVEMSVKLTVNMVLSTAAVVAVAHLLPYRMEQETKLKELQTAVQSTDERVRHDQTKFSQYFDPYQAKSIMQAETNRVSAQQRRVIWLNPEKR